MPKIARSEELITTGLSNTEDGTVVVLSNAEDGTSARGRRADVSKSRKRLRGFKGLKVLLAAATAGCSSMTAIDPPTAVTGAGRGPGAAAATGSRSSAAAVSTIAA